MFNLKKILQESKTIYLESFANNQTPICMDHPIVTITFDDAPRTAMTNGVPILDKFDIKASFYVSLGLSASNTGHSFESTDETDNFLTSEDILELHRNGHDICCHTYSHYMLNKGSANRLALDAQKNVRELCALLNISSVDHFSYPFGQVSFSAKRQLAKNYKTMRSSRPGINKNSTDMCLLRAISIYDRTFNRDNIIQLIESAEHSGGWLIFYTHGVTHNPDPYSCTPNQLEWIIKQCKSSSSRILTISEAYNSIVSTC